LPKNKFKSKDAFLFLILLVVSLLAMDLLDPVFAEEMFNKITDTFQLSLLQDLNDEKIIEMQKMNASMDLQDKITQELRQNLTFIQSNQITSNDHATGADVALGITKLATSIVDKIPKTG